MQDKDSLTLILNDPLSSAEEKAQAQRELEALDGHADDGLADSFPVHDATRMILAALNVERVEDLNEEIYERYCVAHSVRDTDPIVREFRYWVPPCERTLWLLTNQDRVGGLRWWWNNVLNICGDREDVKIRARARLAELND